MTAGSQLPSAARRLTTLFLCLLAAWLGLAAAAAADTELAPGPVVVRVQQEGSGGAIESAIVRLGGRMATTGVDGVATLDGVPAGSYALFVERHGFDDLHREGVRLGEGTRAPLDVRLVPFVLVKLEGSVTTQEGHPVAGARLELHSLELRSGRDARAVLSTTWDGRFTALELPIGSYEVSVTAAGCEPLVRRFELGREPAPLELVLARTVDEAALRVHVTDARTSEPLANASVTVAEAWPIGVLAQGTTDASGSARFERLRFTQRNRLDAEGRVDAGGGRGSVQVEAEGHETLVVSYPLPLEGTLDVALEPVDELEEVESNDAISSAQLIRTGAPVRFSTHENGDHDWFRFHLQERARVVVSIDEGSPIWYRVHVLDSRGNQLTEISVGKGSGGSCTLDLARGDFFVHLHSYYDREASETSHVLRVTRQVAPDPWEPNDAPDAARRLRDGEEARGTIFPLADRDHYRFSLERPGRVRLSIPAMDVWRKLELFDADGRRLTEASGSVGQPLELVYQLAPGSYVALVRQYYDRGCSLTPYSLRLEVLSDDSVDDPEDRPGARLRCARTLALGETAGSTIFPVGDVDRWALALPEPGVLHARLAKPIWCKLLLRGQNGEVLTQATAGGSEPCELSWHCSAARGVVLEVRAYYDREESTDPYLITTWWEPADEVDLLARNETVEDAFPVFLGEPLRGTIFPLGDHDVYRLEVDHPGWLILEGEPAVWVKLLLRDAQGTLVNQTAASVGEVLRLVTPVLPGVYDVETHAYYDREASAHPYVVRVRLDRAEPEETVPLAASPVRQIELGELVRFAIDQNPDHDRFRFLVPQEGPFFLRMRPSVWVRWRLFDEASGRQVREGSGNPNEEQRFEFAAAGPTRFSLEVQEYYERNSTLEPSWLSVDTVDRPLVGGRLLAEPSADDPREVRFTLATIEGLAAPARASLDADGDGRSDLTLAVGQPATHRYARQGLYVARASVESADGRKGESHAWVQAIGTVPREGVHVVVQHPAEGATIEGPEPCRARAISYTGGDVRRVDFSLDGQVVATSYTPPFEAELPWATLGAGEHRLSVRAVDARGEEGVSERTLTVSEYFGLLPEDAATITGDDVAVSWTGPGFGRAAVRYRKQGEESWMSVEGERARARRVVLRELDPETVYEIQPLGDGEPGPVQTVTRVRGLAFGRDTYSARIERDYDQRLGISIRNHADESMRVSLESGEPPAESELLVSFIGEGSEGAPIELGPGEERDFLLALSAQDVNVERVSFPIRIQSDTGFADEAEVVLDVRLPEVKLRWEELPVDEGALARAWMLHNDGDALTDLFLRSASDDLFVDPELDHGIFPAGESLRVEASPRLYEGFKDVESQIEFGAVAEESTLDVALALPEGKTLFGVQLVAGAGALDEDADHESNLLAARSMAGAYLNPDSVDWTQRTNPEDTDEDGRVDRWNIDDELEGILWVGDDTDGDGEVDFVHADIGSDGQYDYSAYRAEDGWQQTNLVEAWLEMGFALGQARTSYKRHDLDLVMNGTVVGELRDVIPEGNYTFRLPPTAIRFDATGVPSGNEVEIRSKHLNGGHYVVGSDFRIKVRMTGTRVWTAADSEEDARKAVLETEGLSVDGPDYSVSSAELEVTGRRERGEPLLFTLPVRNVGATRTSSVAVALMKDVGGGQRVELARTYALDVPLTGSVQARIPWTAASGAHTLWVVLDPEHETGDTNDGNDAAAISFEVPGDEGPPTAAFAEPEEGAKLSDTVVPVVVEASDDDVVIGVELSVDGGLPLALSTLPEPGRWSGQVLLQPGRHRLLATVRDGSNNVTQAARYVDVDAPLPTVEILQPEQDVKLAHREVEVELRADESAKVVAARVNGGPWIPGRLEGGTSIIEVPLTYGDATIEVQATNDRGARATASVKVHCGEQPEETKEEPEDEPEEPKGEEPAAPPPTTVDVEGVGEVDALGPESRPLPPAGGTDRDSKGATGDSTGASSSTTGGGGVDAEPERPRVGSAPATGAQPPGLPPVRELPPPVGDEEETDDAGAVEPEREPEAAEPPAEEPALEPGEVLGGPSPPVPASQRPRPSRPRGGFIGARAHRNDWYCTNRPKIKVKFRLPDWLKNKKLPKPGTKEFDAMMVRLLTDMQMRGFKTGKLEAFQKALLRRIKGMNQPGDLPGFLESFNIGGPAPEDPKALAEWRKAMEDRAQAWFLRLLASGDPSLVAEGLKARGAAIGEFDLAMKEHAEGAIKEIEGNQKLVEDCAEALPVVGEMSDLYAFITGETALSGQRCSALERVIRLAGVLGPLGLEQLIKRSPGARLVLQGIGEMGEAAGKSGKRMLAGVLNLPPGKVDEAFEAIGKFLTKERHLIGESMEDKMAREARIFAKSPEGIADGTRRLKDHAEARDLVDKLRKASPDSDEFRAAVKELQANKTAQALINRADVPDALRKDVNAQIKGWYKAADDGVAEGFEGLYRNGKPSADDTARIANELGISTKQAEEFQQQVEAFARKHGVDPSEVKVDKLTITNRRPPKPGEVPKTSVGRDRDVTFQIQAPMKDPQTGKVLIDSKTGLPRMIGEDIDHVVSKNVYDRSFWQASGQGDMPRLPDGSIDQKRIGQYAEDTMDQMVTSDKHIEAYNTGPVQLDDFLDKGLTPTLTNIDDVCDTVSHKSTHWFGKADEAAEAGDLIMAARHQAEGMRQATKQYDDLVLSRVRQYGLDPNVHVPARLQESMEVFRMVKDGKISPAKAEAMLKSIGTSTEGAVRDMAGFLNGLEKTTGVGWRRVKSAELVNKLSDLQKAGGSGWQDDAFQAINNSLKNGEISGTQFAKLRADVSTSTIQRMKVEYPSQWRQHLKSWADKAYQGRLINLAEKKRLQAEAE